MNNKLSIKTQTSRSTKMLDKGCINANIIHSQIEVGIVTSKGWGDFDEADEPTIEISTGREYYAFPLRDFLFMLRQQDVNR